MKWRLLNVVSAISLFLCIAAAALWVRSTFLSDALTWGSGMCPDGEGYVDRALQVLTTDGSLGMLFIQNRRSQATGKFTPKGWSWTTSSETGLLRDVKGHLGFSFSNDRGASWRVIRLLVPDWSLVLVTMILPTTWISLRRRNRARWRSSRGLCVRCGYDLRASEGRCPECGTAIRAHEEPRT